MSETTVNSKSDANPATATADDARAGAGVFMHIGEVAARTELSLRSLRHWEEVGLLRPSARTDGGFRLYTEEDVEKILVIRRMKPLGFTLDQMKTVIQDIALLRDSATTDDDRAGACERVNAIRTEAVERRQRLALQVAMADEFIDLLEREGT
ncbi:MerR family transcriptional regulator [Nocardioides sp. SOB77]|uniref:MerR family transcriptional regulator n=1 Tax=Nocardioides oceani TaxID=3058369 RepID=A0ABT8FMK7_9ACTN|nr:MerR family transcriptional regulator [Nocardioides oceani]MDN4175750.1 MerR family transcriptional regulator [Nocardioides oceani]